MFAVNTVLVVGAIFLGVDVFVGSIWLSLIGLSFIASAGTLYWSGSVAAAALTFCVLVASSYFAMAKKLNKPAKNSINVDAGEAVEAIDSGSVKYLGAPWKAKLYDGGPLEVGKRYLVLQVLDGTIFVKEIDSV